MNDDKLLEKIKRSADSCDVPEGLKPEMLDFVRPSEQGIRDRKIRRGIRGIAAAAAVVVLLLILTQVPLTQKESSDSSNTASVRSRGLDTKDSGSTDDTTGTDVRGEKVLIRRVSPLKIMTISTMRSRHRRSMRKTGQWMMSWRPEGLRQPVLRTAARRPQSPAVADTAPAEEDTGETRVFRHQCAG